MRHILRIRRCRAFTLTEVVLVLLIIGIAAAAGAPTLIDHLERSGRTACADIAEDILSETERYLVSEQFMNYAEVSCRISEVPERYSANEVSVSELEGGYHSSIKTISGELYRIGWSLSDTDDSIELSVSCTEHGTELKRHIGLWFVGI